MKNILPVLTLIFLVASCGSETATEQDDSFNQPEVDTNVPPDAYGYLLDSAVHGLRYKSGDHHGVTDSDGRFGYISGERVEFYIGNSLIAHAETPVELLTPYEFSGASPFPPIDVLRILQTLDDDADPTNGIQITADVHELAESVVIEPTRFFVFPPDSKIDTDAIETLTSATKAGVREVVSAYSAYLHFKDTLHSFIYSVEQEIQQLADESTCTSNDQCTSIELESLSTIYCPPAGPTIVYSTYDIDQSLLDSLIYEREYFIDAKYSIEHAAGASDNSTGLCSTLMNPLILVCNASNRCEIET